MPNGFDEDMIKHLDINVKEYSDKENVMITVGRLGTNQKKHRIIFKGCGKHRLERLGNLFDWRY